MMIPLAYHKILCFKYMTATSIVHMGLQQQFYVYKDTLYIMFPYVYIYIYVDVYIYDI